ncbi:MAG TPA: hypothetical protein VF398_06450 [bacterium]|jgi:hypothetical protein
MKNAKGFLLQIAGGMSFLLAALCFPNPAQADDYEYDGLLYNEVVFLRGTELGCGARALALGGAYRALSDDLSGLYWNPAGLASVRRIEIGLGVSQAWTTDETRIGGSDVSNRLGRTRMNEVGLVFPVPAYRGSLVFALGYQQVHGFDSFGTFQAQSADSTYQADELESGRLGLWSLGMAVDLSEIVSAGLAVRWWTGYDDYSFDDQTVWDELNWLRYNQTIDEDYSGFNLLTGVLIKPIPSVRVGATLETPVKFSVDQSYDQVEQSSSNGEYASDSFSENYGYHVSRSFRFGLGAAWLIQRLGISGDVLLHDWSQINFTDNPPYLDRQEANQEIVRRLAPKADFHVGLEYWLPFLEARLQAGYAYLSTPFNDTVTLGNKQVFSGGFGILLDPSLHLQTSASLSQWDRSIGGWDEELKLTHLLVTLSYRF